MKNGNERSLEDTWKKGKLCSTIYTSRYGTHEGAHYDHSFICIEAGIL